MSYSLISNAVIICNDVMYNVASGSLVESTLVRMYLVVFNEIHNNNIHLAYCCNNKLLFPVS